MRHMKSYRHFLLITGLFSLFLTGSGCERSPSPTIVYNDKTMQVQVNSDLRDPLWAAGRCDDLLVNCVKEKHDLDVCVINVPSCKTAHPWEEASPCCPTSCRDLYQTHRTSGMSAIDSFDHSFTEPGSKCYPGVPEAIRDDIRAAKQ